MSSTIRDKTGRIRHCDTCQTVFNSRESPRDEHCSHECYYEDKGENILNYLHNDHRICSSCMRYVKRTYCPDEEFLEEVSSIEGRALKKGAGYTSTDDGTLTLDITSLDVNTRPPGLRKDSDTLDYCYIGLQFPTEHTRYLYGSSGPWVCECGNVDLSEHNELLARQDEDAMVLALLDRLREFYEKGAIQESPDRGVFFEYFEDRDADLPTSVGAALYKS